MIVVVVESCVFFRFSSTYCHSIGVYEYVSSDLLLFIAAQNLTCLCDDKKKKLDSLSVLICKRLMESENVSLSYFILGTNI